MVSSSKPGHYATSLTERKSLSFTAIAYFSGNYEPGRTCASISLDKYAVNSGVSIDRIKKEIEKCIVLCANCHAIRHYNIRNQKQTSPGIAGEFEQLNTILTISPEEEEAYNMQFEE